MASADWTNSRRLAMQATMERSFWSSRWQAGRIGFHQDRVNQNLVAHWRQLADGAGRVLVPLCGKSHDLEWLAQQGHAVEGVEFVQEAVEAFFAERQIEPESHMLGAARAYSKDELRVVVGDFFELTEREIPRCDWVYDRAALVAVAPGRRREYIEQLHRLTRNGAGLMLINFEHDIGSGPPFSIARAELLELCRSSFELELHEEHDILEREGRFAERGATYMLEQVWFGRRLD